MAREPKFHEGQILHWAGFGKVKVVGVSPAPQGELASQKYTVLSAAGRGTGVGRQTAWEHELGVIE